MTLRPGIRIGAYEIESLVGEGGLGEVWKARDVESGRATALRMLPTTLLDDRERFARFDRDIRALTTLHHPNIATVDGIVDAGEELAVAVAWVDWPSLTERIRRGPLPFTESAFIAAQMADAVGAAHDRAVVHGNLQPRNIKVGSDLSVKVLDLGLNTLFDPEIQHVSDTLPSPLARAVSVIIGTASYMSPERVRGAHVDPRADVWAFGCVLFEMLTGRPAFGATDVAETFALVLNADPEWTWIPASTPAALVSMLKTCLKKDSTARRQDLSSVSIELRDMMEQQEAREAVLRDSVLEGRVSRSSDLDEDDLVHQIRPTPDVLDKPIGPGGTGRYGEALEQLGKRDRELIRARVEQALSYDDMARLFALSSADAARMSVTRALKRLLEKMKDLSRK